MRKTRVTDTRNSFVFNIWMKQDLNNYTFLLLYLPDGREKWTEVEEACAARWVGEEEVGKGCTAWWEREVDC